MEVLQELRENLKKVHGSMKRVAEKRGKTEAWIRLVFRGIETDQAVIKAALEVLEENKGILAERERQRNEMAKQIHLALCEA
jgi:hypothetical protein